MKNIKLILFTLIFISTAIAQNGAWYGMANVLANMQNGCCICYGGNDTIFALKGNYSKTFYAYAISQNTWVTEQSSWSGNVLVGPGGSITNVGTTLYAIAGNQQSNFFRYRSQNGWTPLINAPGTFTTGAALCWGGGDTIYAFKGNSRDFYRYSIQGTNWQTAQIPGNIPAPGAGASMCYYEPGSCIYGISGGTTFNFWRYNIESRTWDINLAHPISYWNAGASLIWNGGTKIYGVLGNAPNGDRDTILVYDIPTNAWKDTIVVPHTTGGSNEGTGLLAWDNRKGQLQLYIATGDNHNYFYRYCLPLVQKFLPLGQDFEAIQFPPPGWQSKSDVYTDVWQRSTNYSGTTPYQPNIAVDSFEQGAGDHQASFISPKFFVGTRPALIKVRFYMYNTNEGSEPADELKIEYYKPNASYPVTVATFPRRDPSVPLWNPKEVTFVETDTIQIAFHGIDADGDNYPLLIDSIKITLDTTVLYSNTFQATAANQSRLLARKPETQRLHTIFRKAFMDASGNPDGRALLYYSFSDDASHWSSPVLIDTTSLGAANIRSYSAIATGVFDGKEPWIVYVRPDRTAPYVPNAIRIAIRRQNGTWKKVTLQNIVGEYIYGVSMAMGLTQGMEQPAQDLAYVVAHTHNIVSGYRLRFFAFETTGTTFADMILDEGNVSQPSIAITPGDYINIAYTRHEDGQDRIYYITHSNRTDNYSTRMYGIDNWVDRLRVSQFNDYTEPATYPSVEAYGQAVIVSWRGLNEEGNNIGEIWRRERPSINDWRNPQIMSLNSTEQESNYPVMSTLGATAYQEDINGVNKEIYANFWRTHIVNISNTQTRSLFPHINAEVPEPPPQSPYEISLNTIWTESLSKYVYQIMSNRYTYTPDKKLEYYTVETGDSIQSPLCLQRDGYIAYPQLPIDFGNQKLTYELPYLNPLYHHKIRVVVFQRAQGRFRQNFVIDSIPLGSIEYAPNIAETIEVTIPKSCYQNDSRAILEISKNQGQFVALAKPLIVYQYEIPETTNSSGTQSAGQITILTKPRLFQNYPNPFRTQTAIRYSLPAQSKVSLIVYDISGREVRNLIDENKEPGLYTSNWDGKDNQGKSVSSGVYFYRLKTGDYQNTDRAIIIR